MRVGIDAQPIEEVRRSLEDHGDHYRRRLFVAEEVAACGGWGADPSVSAQGLAARFAAKEAVLKVLRVSDRVPSWRDIAVVSQPGGWPALEIKGVARDLANAAGLEDFEVSLTHTDTMAVAVVVAQGGHR